MIYFLNLLDDFIQKENIDKIAINKSIFILSAAKVRGGLTNSKNIR